MNSAPAHLESKLRLFLDLSVGQLAAVFFGILLGVVWAKWLAPFGGMAAALSGTYLAALPVVPVFVASQSEFDLGRLVLGAIGWRRLSGRYLPGAGERSEGYLLLSEANDRDPGDSLELDLQALWEQPTSKPAVKARRR
jgi:hypothetical protein